MRLGDYYRGLPLNLRTALPPDEVARRIGAAVASPFRPFATGIIGSAYFNRLHLRYRPSLFSYNAMPVLTGPIKAEQGSLLLLKYRGHLATRLAFPLATVMVLVGLSIMMASGATAEVPAWGIGLIFMAMLLAVALPLMIHSFFIRNAEADMAHLAAFLRSTLDARDVLAPEGWTGG